jgi:hypothetical protein
LNPQPPVLETGALPVELLPCATLRAVTSATGRQGRELYHLAQRVLLAGLLVHSVLAVPSTELLHLDALTVIELVLLRDVVASLAVLAGQSHLDPLFVLRHLFLPTRLLELLAGPTDLPSSGGGSRTRDTTIMSRVL